MHWTVLTLITLPVVLFAFYLYRRLWVHRYFKRLGIPGPEPHWLFGNLLSLASEGTRHLQLYEWTKKYGPIYGYYEGPTPCLIISDLDAINNVFIKQFGTFHARKLYHFQPDPDDPKESVSVFFARGDRWKRLRTIINPAFSSKKMKEMTPQMQIYQRYFMDLLAKRLESGTSCNIFELLQLLTMDTIGECAFGIAMSSLKSEGRDNPTLTKIQEMLENTFKLPKILLITTVLTELKPLFQLYVDLGQKFKLGAKGPTEWIYDTVRQIVKVRRANTGPKQNDLLQLMLDGDIAEDSARSTLINEKSATTLTKGGSVLKALTLDEIEAQVYIFMIAGYETTSNALAYTAYELALNPDKQSKLLEELDKAFPDPKTELDYDSLSAKALPYLDAVVNETLRLYPVGLLVSNRIAMEETSLLGFTIPKGLPIQPDVVAVHHDPEVWGPVDPAKFHPERWLPTDDNPFDEQRRELAFLTFGLGPRTCVGMRFAELEMKMTLVNILRRYRFARCVETEVPLQLKVAHTMTPKNGIWVAVEKR